MYPSIQEVMRAYNLLKTTNTEVESNLKICVFTINAVHKHLYTA